jgi:hypothetical protein
MFINLPENIVSFIFIGKKWMSLKDGIPARNYGISVGIFFIICKIFRHGIFYRKLKSASDREFYFLNDANVNLQKLVFWFHENSNFLNSCIASHRE